MKCLGLVPKSKHKFISVLFNCGLLHKISCGFPVYVLIFPVCGTVSNIFRFWRFSNFHSYGFDNIGEMDKYLT